LRLDTCDQLQNIFGVEEAFSAFSDTDVHANL
jgi:hypothetical protein